MGFAVAIFGLVFMGWADDFISLQGERIIYTVQCAAGIWTNGRCSGTLVASDRYRFRASKSLGEVVFWRLGHADEKQRLAPCVVQDGRNWSCSDVTNPPRTITLALSQGQLMPDPEGRTQPCHVVTKWRWWLLHAGFAR